MFYASELIRGKDGGHLEYLPDYMLDEPDPPLCEHGRVLPCRICQAEAADRAHDSLKED